MLFRESMYRKFENLCIEKYGNITGMTILLDGENILKKMVSEIDDRNNQTIRWHLEKCLLPTIAMYKCLKKVESKPNEAYDITLKLCQEVAENGKKKMKFIGYMPFGYLVFKFFAKRKILKMYPLVGWDTEWVRFDNDEIHFNYHSCLYKETTEKYNCSEMCSIFCANDVTIFSGLAPNIVFERNGTLANGNESCDFHFKNGKRKKLCGGDYKKIY